MSTSTLTLTPTQRSRLIRSTRKVGALLGETPVLDITSKSGASSSSKCTLSNRSCTPHPTINITIDINPLSSDSGPRSPLSPIFSNSPSVVSPAHESCEHYTIYMKKRRMSKLARTFGEKVPSELVTFGDIPRSSFEKRRRFTFSDVELGFGDTLSKKKDLCSVHSTESDTVFDIKIEPCSPISSDASSEISFDIIDTSEIPTPTAFSSPSLRQRRPASMLVTSPRKATFHSHTSSETVSSNRRNSDRDLAFAKLTQNIRDNSVSSSSTKSGSLQVYMDEDTHRKQKGWSGEWNRGDMSEVVNKLRMLK